MEQIPPIESLEKGENVEIILKFIRHGERDKDGRLLDFGREVTKNLANESGFNQDDFDLIKPIGSDAGYKKGVGMRAMETATIYAQELAVDNMGTPKVESSLNYETIITPEPYDHQGIYNANLPENYDSLTDEEKSKANYKAQQAVLDHLANDESEAAMQYKKEVAGSFAHLIQHYQTMIRRINSDSKVLIPAGTHGGTMEFLLQQALVRTDKDGNKIIGFKTLDEIGGAFAPSDSYDVDVRTDETGNFEPLQVFFGDPNREVESTGPLYLDEDKIKELADFYKGMHGIK